jgi:hypothetical protein
MRGARESDPSTSLRLEAYLLIRWSEAIDRNDRLCENYVHGSTKLTTNGMALLESKYLSARPEPSRRAPMEFHTV